MLKSWITYYSFLLASLVFALLYPGQASSAFFYALLLLPPASLVLLAIMLKGFKYEQSVDRLAAAKGETVHYRLTARNRGILMLPYVEISFYGSGGSIYRDDFAAVSLAVPPRGARAIEIAFTGKYKGVCDLGVKQIKLRDFLGLFNFKQEVGKLGTLVIYPRIVPVEGFPVMAGYDGEARASGKRSRESAETISEIRKYVSGDRLRSIHWKLSAKRDELMVKNFEQSSGAVVELMLDACCAGRKGEDALILEDKLVECAVALAHHFALLGIPTTLYFLGDTPIRRKLDGMSDFQLAYRLLSEAAFGRVSSFADSAGIARNDGVRRKTVVIITSGLTEGVCGEALKLADSGCMAALVCVEDGKGAEAPGGGAGGKAMTALIHSGVMIYVLGIGEDIGSALTRKAV